MITYLKGDATAPKGHGPRVIAHICNDIGAWGAGFVLALSRRWPEPEEQYRHWSRNRHNYEGPPGPFVLGGVQLVRVEPAIWVANMIAQEGIRRADNTAPLRYDALRTCLWRLSSSLKYMVAPTLHMPRIGCGLGGGRWEMVEPLLTEMLGETPIFVYDL